jgi:hypothetical protein
MLYSPILRLNAKGLNAYTAASCVCVCDTHAHTHTMVESSYWIVEGEQGQGPHHPSVVCGQPALLRQVAASPGHQHGNCLSYLPFLSTFSFPSFLHPFLRALPSSFYLFLHPLYISITVFPFVTLPTFLTLPTPLFLRSQR